MKRFKTIYVRDKCKILVEFREIMAEFFCDIEILRNEGEFEARVEGLTPNVMSLKSDNLEELLEQLTIELEDKLN